MLPGRIAEVSLEFALGDPPRLLAAHGPTRKVLGFAAGDLLSDQITFQGRIHPGDADLAAAIFSAAGAASSGTACLRVRHADGRIRCLDTDFQTAGNGAGARVCLRLRDAKEIWRHTNLEERSANFRALVENTSEAMVFKNINHVYTAASPVFKEAVQYALAGRDLIGLTDYDFLTEEDADVYYALEMQALSTGAPLNEVREIVRTASGAWIEVREHPVTSATGEVIGLFTVAVDLTQRILAEENLQRAGHSLPESQRLAPVGTYVMDIRRGMFATSATIDSILGIGEEYPHDIGGWERLLHPEERLPMMDYLREVIATPGRIFNREYRVIRQSDGALVWVHGIGRLELDRHGRPLLMGGTLQDISVRKATEAELWETRERLQMFIEHAPAALAMFDREMRYLAVSRRWRELDGRMDQQTIGKSHYESGRYIPQKWKEAHRRGLAGEAQSCDEDSVVYPDGREQWIRWEILPWRTAEGDIGGIILFVEDITAQKRAEERLKLAASVFAHASEAIFVTDLGGNLIEANEAFTSATGYPRDEVLGRHSRILDSDRHDELFYAAIMNSVQQTGRWSGEQWFRRKDGSAFEVRSTITTVFDRDGKPTQYVGMFFDISPIREQERKLEQVIRYDELTGLPNRSQANERLRQAIAAVGQSNQMVAVIFFDVDDFKLVNEIHGRDTADAMLVAAASQMKLALRDGDTLARIGGDEFLAVLPDLSDMEVAAGVVERLLQAISEPQAVGDLTLQLSATAGATFYPQAEEVDADQLIRQAVQAMYEAKLAGKNRYHVFDPARDYNLRGRHVEIGRICQALRAREFVLHYQPKVNMATGALIGTEALIRWQHPQRGLLLPQLFLPAIEGHDLAVELGEWVIETALCQIEAWAEAGYRIPVSVNVSARHLQQADFVARLRALLQANPNVDPTCLELEILETSTVQDVAHVSQIIDACLADGIQVAIDDFGTGYSALSYLKRLPAPVLKIDQAFVRDMLEDPDDLALLQGVIGLANAFRRTMVAEGVETVEQGVLLLKLGCTLAQGYGIARPMPAGELVSWYSNWWPDARWNQVVPVPSQDWPILVAQVELVAWKRALERFVSGLQPTPPELDERRSRFGIWLEAEQNGPRGGSPLLRQVGALHHKAHVAARKAVEMKESGHHDEAMAQVRALVLLRGQIEADLNALSSRGDVRPGIYENAHRAATPAKRPR